MKRGYDNAVKVARVAVIAIVPGMLTGYIVYKSIGECYRFIDNLICLRKERLKESRLVQIVEK